MTYRKTKKTEEHKDERRRLIFDTAAKVFARNGYHDTAVKDITDEAGISVGTFYLYFKNKEDLFEKLYDDMNAKIKAINEFASETCKNKQSLEERFSRIIASSIWSFCQYRELAKIMLIDAVGLNPRFEEKSAEINSRSVEQLQGIFADLKRRGLIDVPDERVAAVAYEAASRAVVHGLRTPGEDLRAWAYPMAVFLLQALKVDFRHEDVQRHTGELFAELDETGLIYKS